MILNSKTFTLGFFFALFLCITFLPVAWMFGNSIYEHGNVSFIYYRDIFLTQKYVPVIINSLLFASLTTILSCLMGVPTGFFLAKTLIPLNNFFKVCLLIPLIIPSYTTGIAWTSLLGKTGFLNTLLSQYTPLSPETISSFIYSVYGGAWVLSFNLFPVVMLITEYALKNINPRLEESGLVTGNVFLTIRRITLPLITPAILSGMMIVFVLALSEFGIPSLLQINVLTTQVFTQFSAFYNERAATASSFPLIAITVAFLIIELIYFRGKSFEILGRKPSAGTLKYHQKWLTIPGVVFCVFTLSISIIIPLSTLIAGAQTLSAYYDAFFLVKNSIQNSLLFGVIGATLLCVIGFFLGYLSEKIRTRLRNGISSFIWVLFAIPATVIGVGLIKLCNRPEGFFQGIYGSWWIVIIGYVARFLPLSSRIMTNYFKQIPGSLEDAGAVTGISWFKILQKIFLPLLAQGITATWLMCFIFCIGELGTTILLYPPGQETLPIALFTNMVNSPEHIVSALSIIIVVMTLLPVGVFLGILKYFHKNNIFRQD
ncbi:MAG TPA: ABC transporter permease [Candidatus Brocadiaceae bacterium]